MERTVDDFFTTNNIWHEPEPLWPTHPVYNRNGLKRADWILEDGTHVEAAGMMADVGYAERMRSKRALAHDLSIPLVVLEPRDLLTLDLVFSRWATR